MLRHYAIKLPQPSWIHSSMSSCLADLNDAMKENVASTNHYKLPI